MPLPPFHLAPGVAAKVFGARHFSFSVFTFSQVLMDIEPLVRIYAGTHDLHGFTNTFVGATVVGAGSVALGRPVCERLLEGWNEMLDFRGGHWFRVNSRIGLGCALVSAAIGVYVHAILDGLMHTDVQPWAPFAGGNPFVGLMSIYAIHLLCTGLGLFGLIGLMGVWFWNRFTLEAQK